jgi:hypothetical protein
VKPLLPLIPEDRVRGRRPGEVVTRTAYAAALAQIEGASAIDVAQRLYGANSIARSLLVTRAATKPADRTTAGWAGDLARQAMADFVASLQPLSAAARLIAAGTQVSLAGLDSVVFPRRAGLPNSARSWVGEGSPLPIVSYTLEGALLGPPRKIAFGSAMTRETVTIGGQSVVETLLREDAAATLDASMFDAAGPSNLRPAGLLSGLAPLPASTATDLDAAMVIDLGALATAIADAGGSDVVYIADPALVAAVHLRHCSNEPVTIWPSMALNDVILAVDPAAFASSIGEIRIEASTESVVHMESSTPLPIIGSGPVLAAPSYSAFQMDLVVIRCILSATWCLRQNLIGHIVNPIWA